LAEFPLKGSQPDFSTGSNQPIQRWT